MAGVAKSLEAMARSIRRARKRAASSAPQSQLAEEIALLSERLDGLRDTHAWQMRSLLREECHIGTDLMRLESYEPRLFWYRGKPRELLKRRRSDLKRERRKQIRDHERELAELHERLCKLLRQHTTLGGSRR